MAPRICDLIPLPESRRPCSEKGFTLLEALLAIAVLAIAMLGTATMLFSGLSTSAGSNTRYTATIIAQSTMEDLMTRRFETLSSHLIPITTTANGVQYKTRWRFTNISSGIRYFNISTNWKDKTGSHGVSIAAVRSR